MAAGHVHWERTPENGAALAAITLIAYLALASREELAFHGYPLLASGEILEDRYNSQTKTFYWLGTWNFPLHVGTIWRLPSKILWLVACLILTTAPVTGV